MDLNGRIGYETHNQRMLKRLTLEQVAERMEVASKNTVSRMELGITKITIEDLKRFCDAVGCPWMEVLEKAHPSDG